jgi:ABC-type glutathione transport system ATPase component
MATHDRRIGENLADEVVVLFHGRLVASGPYKEVLASQDPALMAVLRDLT